MKHQKMTDEEQLILNVIGMEIRKLRLQYNLSYETMAERCGIARNTYNLLENGKINFQFSTLKRVLVHHGIPFSKFFKNVEKEAENWYVDET
jgi:transcriptional regulator with XRE-family HTH domain